MGTKCCWAENKDNSENQSDIKVDKSDAKKKESTKDKKSVIKRSDIKRKSYPLQSKKGKEELKKEDSKVDALDKRSSTASFHSATSCNDNIQVSNPNNTEIIDSKYQG